VNFVVPSVNKFNDDPSPGNYYPSLSRDAQKKIRRYAASFTSHIESVKKSGSGIQTIDSTDDRPRMAFVLGKKH
jgi:hypothetical protein